MQGGKEIFTYKLLFAKYQNNDLSKKVIFPAYKKKYQKAP